MSIFPGNEPKRSNYRILGLVGQGQFGRVFCGVHRQTGRLVALKNLEHARFPTSKFLRELRFLLSLQHSNIVTCYALEHTRTGRYLVMDYCEGGTLRGLMENECRLSLFQSLKLVAEILAGLDHAHSRGIIHCDIKPENILLNVEQTGWIARISDFGIARLSQEINDYEGMGNTGSPAYMSPERFYGQHSLTSDLYSVGIILFEMLAGYRPFSGTPAELMSAHLNQPLKVPDSIPEVWHPILITALRKLAGRRFRSAAEMLTALKTAGTSVGMTPWAETPLQLSPLECPPPAQTCLFTATEQESLEGTIAQLILTPTNDALLPTSQTNDGYYRGLYQIRRNQVLFQSRPIETWTTSHQSSLIQQTAAFPTPVLELVLRSQGCFALTSDGIFWITPGDYASSQLTVRSLLEVESPSLMAIESRGRWLATLSWGESKPMSLKWTALPCRQSSVGLAPLPVPLPTRGQVRHPLRLIALDACHVAIISHSKSSRRGKDCDGTVCDVFGRRGDRLGSLSMSLCVGEICPTQTPYRLMATDVHNPCALVLIDLKPYRVWRIGLNIIPNFMIATTWGYVVADKNGQIVLLDDYGQQISQIDGPSHITAITAFDNHGLLISTWDGTHGILYTLDLRELDIDLLF